MTSVYFLSPVKPRDNLGIFKHNNESCHHSLDESYYKKDEAYLLLLFREGVSHWSIKPNRPAISLLVDLLNDIINILLVSR